jgi:hypothetical protein
MKIRTDKSIEAAHFGAGMAGNEEHLDVRFCLQKALGELTPILVGQGNVGNQEGDLVPKLLERFYRIAIIAGFQDPIAQGFQSGPNGLTVLSLIINHKNGLRGPFH